MKLPVGWLREHVDFPVEVGRLAEDLTLAGLAVDAIEGNGDDAVHGEAGQGQVVGQAGDLGREVHELAQPADGDLHPGNCSRKRRSLS